MKPHLLVEVEMGVRRGGGGSRRVAVVNVKVGGRRGGDGSRRHVVNDVELGDKRGGVGNRRRAIVIVDDDTVGLVLDRGRFLRKLYRFRLATEVVPLQVAVRL